jgi:hypothetical protein
MSKEILEALWYYVTELNDSVGLKASTMDEVYDKINEHARIEGIDPEELEIEY